MSYSLIANTGLHFTTTHININVEEPLVMSNGKTLKWLTISIQHGETFKRI